MKCPYRKIVKKKVEYTDELCELINSTITQDFADCYKEDCPYYYENGLFKPNCSKVDKELTIQGS